MKRPWWWRWEIVLTPHAEDRLEQRGLSEVDVRVMLEDPVSVEPARRCGRWTARARHRGREWVIVLEPDFVEEKIFVITAYDAGAGR